MCRAQNGAQRINPWCMCASKTMSSPGNAISQKKKKKEKKRIPVSVLQRRRVASTDGEVKTQRVLSLEQQQSWQRPPDTSSVEQGMG